MGSDNFYKRRKETRRVREENILKLRSSNSFIISEGVKTEPNYFKEAVDEINKSIDDKYKLKVKIVGMGKNTVSLVKSVDDILNDINFYKTSVIPYDKIFVVFDKDSFDSKLFNEAILMCERKGYIPLWSNQAIEFWFLLHFNLIETRMNRDMYIIKLNEYFKKSGLLNYKYIKNDKSIYSKLCNYGSLENAIKYAKNIYLKHLNEKPSDAESCTLVYKFFEEVNKRIDEIKN